MDKYWQNEALEDAGVFSEVNPKDSDESHEPSSNKLDNSNQTDDNSNDSNGVYSDLNLEMEYSEQGFDTETPQDANIHEHFVTAKDLLNFQDETNTKQKKLESKYSDLHYDALQTIKKFHKETIDGWVEGFQLWATDFCDDMLEFASNILDSFQQDSLSSANKVD